MSTENLDECPDEELIAKARTGDTEAFGKLWERHYETVVAILRPFAADEAECIVSEAFVATWQQLLKGAGPDIQFRGYVISSAKRLTYRLHKQYQRFVPDEELDTGLSECVEDAYTRIETREAIIAAFDALPPRWAEALWMRAVEDKSRTEMCEHFELTPNAMSVLTHRARRGFVKAFSHVDNT